MNKRCCKRKPKEKSDEYRGKHCKTFNENKIRGVKQEEFFSSEKQRKLLENLITKKMLDFSINFIKNFSHNKV